MIRIGRTEKRNYGTRLVMLGLVVCLFLIGCRGSGIAFPEKEEEESPVESRQVEGRQEPENRSTDISETFETLKNLEIFETVQEDILLTSAPPLWLQDTLSSTWKEYEVASGNYNWNYKEQDQMTSVLACGVHPLEEGKIKKPITLPRYNQMDSVPYEVSCIQSPARIRVDEYSADDLGNTGAEMLSSEIYEESFIIPLKPRRVYELTAEWDQADLEKNGCYGSASYVIVTE